ncbi:NAD kinase [Paenibacillus flagellatus]|uniref:NAD kinase n=1 Tax=Paenibacillus flagellatus TaxID=2211139 RepID=A0A2V5JVQ4_9BACL|nr:NAD kinase [Paenibacillus flagellatus]PYI50825.1 NAD kinase [Paenibacillus flagellatus]
MKYNVVNRGDETSVRTKDRFHELAAASGLTVDAEHPDVVVSIGGDGTMLHAFHLYADRLDRISFVGIHTGHLGFYADWKPMELETLIRHMATDTSEPIRTVKYPIIEIEISNGNTTETHLALNECTLKGVEGTLVAELRINDERFEMFRGDGICISTPTGSTGYNRSLNGAILHPSLEAVQIAEMASLNNRVYRSLGSSIVLPKHHHCDIYPKKGQKILFTLDHLNMQLTDLTSIRCMVADRKVSFVRYRPFPFWNRVREAFIGDIVE